MPLLEPTLQIENDDIILNRLVIIILWDDLLILTHILVTMPLTFVASQQYNPPDTMALLRRLRDNVPIVSLFE